MADWSDISDPELRKWWEEAATKYYSEVKPESNKADAMSIDGLLASLDGDGVDDRHNGNRRKTRAYLNNILTTIQNLGAFVSGAASNVFSASDICFNAVCYLAKTAKGYHAYFAGIGDLFEAISPFLMRFDVYARDKYKSVELDKHVKSIIFKLLQCFMEICTISSRITEEKKSMRAKFNVALKVFAYQSDGGVKAQLTKIQDLVSQELSMDVAVILKSVKLTESGMVELRTDIKNIAQDVRSVNSTVKSFDGRFTEAQKRDEEERIKNTNRQTIMNVLDIKDGERPWVDAQQKHLTNALQGTGTWLISDPDFQKWADAKGGTFPAILALTANAKCGKTYLCSQAIDKLQETCRNRVEDEGSGQTHLAYYFIDEKEENSMNKALRAIIWQLTESDIVFQKHVAAKCAGREFFLNPEDLWKSTMTTFKPVVQQKDFIIVLDGVDNAVSPDQKDKKHPLASTLSDIFLLEHQKVNIKFLLTGKDIVLQGLGRESSAAFTYVDIVSKNKGDIRRYIGKRLEIVTQDWSVNTEAQQLKTEVGDTLLKVSKGDYYKLDSLFDDISRQKSLEGVKTVLKTADEDREEAAVRHLQRLNRDLDDEDIKDLNEILPWIILTRRGKVSSKHLEEVLLVGRRKRLLSLRKQLLSYAPLLEITNNRVADYVESSLLKEYFNNGAEQGTRHVRDPIHPKEVAIVRRFLETVCDKELFDKFGFEDFFDSRSSFLEKTSISFDCVEGHMKIVHCCLQALCGDDQENDVWRTRSYAIVHLPWHFTKVPSDRLAQAERGIKSKIGELIYRLFNEESSIRNWLTINTYLATTYWVYDESGSMNDIVRWFKDPALSEKLEQGQKEEIWKLTYGSKDIVDLFGPASLIMAREWLFGSKIWPEDAFRWLRAYRSLTKNPKNVEEHFYKSPTSSEVSDAELWARENLDLSEVDPSCALRLAQTYLYYGHGREAVDLCKRGLTVDSESWELSWCLVRSLEEARDISSAIQELERLLEVGAAKEKNRAVWSQMFHKMAMLLNAKDQADDAIALYQRLLHEFPDDYSAMARLISQMKRKKDYRGIIALLEHLEHTETEGKPRLTRLLQDNWMSSRFHHDLSISALRDDSLDFLLRTYSAASKDPVASVMGQFDLRFYHGLALFYHGKSERDTFEALDLWKHNVFNTGTYRDDLNTSDDSSASYLAGAYVELGRKAAANSDNEALDKYVSELQKLNDVVMEMGRDNSLFLGRFNRVVLLLGRLYHLQARKEEAKKCFRDHVSTCLELLSDDDPSNDYQAYKGLGESLGRLYDDESALAAWSLIGPNDLTGEQVAEGTTPKLSGPLYYKCSNRECDHIWTFADQIYVCRDCIDCMFCENCHTELKAGRMEWRICGKDHEFLYVPKWDAEAAEKIGKGHMKVGDDSIMKIEDWVDQLRREYGIEVPEDGSGST